MLVKRGYMVFYNFKGQFYCQLIVALQKKIVLVYMKFY